ncbi:hypothetical protein CEXT_156841 [Caerostris extrusa]|uniref:Uncharacterized protein n=1 Tax=Caerostris extrusa TaxID=172846 RepID=A0AAV4MYU3_CAEEX|nr:hypothetical protein CEXT_156841 [Caerostris extrusa]
MDLCQSIPVRTRLWYTSLLQTESVWYRLENLENSNERKAREIRSHLLIGQIIICLVEAVFLPGGRDLIQNQPPLRRTHPLRCGKLRIHFVLMSELVFLSELVCGTLLFCKQSLCGIDWKISKTPTKEKARGNSFPFINWTDHYLSCGSRVFLPGGRDLIQNQPPLRRTHPLRCGKLRIHFVLMSELVFLSELVCGTLLFANRVCVVSIGKISKIPTKGKARRNSFPFINWTDHYLSCGSRVFTWRERSHPEPTTVAKDSSIAGGKLRIHFRLDV